MRTMKLSTTTLPQKLKWKPQIIKELELIKVNNTLKFKMDFSVNIPV